MTRAETLADEAGTGGEECMSGAMQLLSPKVDVVGTELDGRKIVPIRT